MTDATYSFKIDWNNDGDFGDTGEDVTARVLGLRQSVGFRIGRDEARALSAISPSETSFELDNTSKDYSPDNGSSPLTGLVVPGRTVFIQATHLAVTRDLFTGFIDEFEIKPHISERSLRISALDMLAKFREAHPSTELFRSVQTGTAIGHLLDAMGWPAGDRDIDAGATTIRWWWADGEDGLSALQAIVESEGAPAVAYVDGSGIFVFRDRHHRLVYSASTTSQATFRSSGTEPTFCAPYTYELGWRDVINHVSVDVEERDPETTQTVFESEEVLQIPLGESRTVIANMNDPVYDAVTPVSGTDYTLVSGAVNIAISRTSGKTINIFITCTSGTAVIETVRLRAKPVTVTRTVRVEKNEPGSQTEHGVRTLQDAELKFANRNDADAIASVYLGQRSKRTPVVTFAVNNGNDTRYGQILDRAISDRIHVIETGQTFVDDDFFIEQITHDIGDVGEDHRVQFACERCPADAGVTPLYFEFDSASAGFNEGVFGESGVSFTGEVLILDDATKGQLNNRGLGF